MPGWTGLSSASLFGDVYEPESSRCELGSIDMPDFFGLADLLNFLRIHHYARKVSQELAVCYTWKSNVSFKAFAILLKVTFTQPQWEVQQVPLGWYTLSCDHTAQQ
jgi:hypothetical protein